MCLDTGHHAPGTNIEFIVMQLLRLGKLGSFDFNSRFYADDDLIVGAADPFQLFRIIFEVVRGGGLNNPDVAFMLDQCHNIEEKIPGQIRSVLNVQEMTARALLVDRAALAAAQESNDVLAANAVFMDAFYTDVRPGPRRVARVARTRGRPDGRVRGIRLPAEDRRGPRRRRPGRLGSVSPMADPYAAADGLVRVYPAREPHGAGLVWAHGGAFAFGDLDMPEADWVARSLATRGTTVVSVDYRLAPTPAGFRFSPDGAARDGFVYPAGSDDVLAAWSWTVDNAARLRIDPERLAIGGASAGGNLAAGAVLRLLASGAEVLPALAVLAYPTLLAVQPAPSPELRAMLDANPEADGFGPESRARHVRALPRRTLRRRSAVRGAGHGDARRCRRVPADAHDQRRGR